MEDSKLQDLRKENATLVKELSELKSLQAQLLHENSQESASLKRINILKTQIFQLERQVLALSNAVNSNSKTNQELQKICQELEDRLKSGTSIDDTMKLVKQLQSWLSRPNRNVGAEEHALPLLFMDDFAISKDGGGFSKGGVEKKMPDLLDVCLGRMDHINMKKVGQLESKLSNLFEKLVGLQSSLSTMPEAVPTIFHSVGEHHLDQVTSTCEVLAECCHDLTCLSILVPSSSWSKSRLAAVPVELSFAEVIKKLPSGVRARKEVRDSIEGVCKYFIHIWEIHRSERKALEEDLTFHKSVYHLLGSYIRSLCCAMREGYRKFETSVHECLCKPLTDILNNYKRLSQSSTSEELKDLLVSLQTYSSQLQDAVQQLTSSPDNSGALSAFEKNFFKDLSQLEKQHCSKRK